MRFKVDENLHPDLAAFLCEQGHDAMTIWDQRLQGISDSVIAGVCRREGRVLVTLDLDFADIRSYPPDQYPGLIVMRVGNQSRTHVLAVFKNMLPRLLIQSLAGRLWIVDEHSVRVHESVAEAEGE